MGRVSDANYFLEKWSTSGLGVISILKRASLTYPRLMSEDSKDLIIPLTALFLMIKSKVEKPESLLAFLIWESKECSTKEFFQLVKNLKPNLQELLTSLKTGELPKSKSFVQREIALQNGPIELIRSRLVDRILKVQLKIHSSYRVYSYLNRLVNKTLPVP